MRKDDFVILGYLALLVYYMCQDWDKHENFYIAVLALFGFAMARLIRRRFKERTAMQQGHS